MTPKKIIEEIEWSKNENFRLGEYIYMGMGLVNSHRVCISVAYKMDYCIKKAKEFETADPYVKFTHINKVKIGELKEEEKFVIGS